MQFTKIKSHPGVDRIWGYVRNELYGAFSNTLFYLLQDGCKFSLGLSCHLRTAAKGKTRLEPYRRCDLIIPWVKLIQKSNPEALEKFEGRTRRTIPAQ